MNLLEKNVEWVLSFLFVPLLGLFGTVAVILASIGKFHDKRMSNIIEASATWRELAESRGAELLEKQDDIKERDLTIKRYKRQNDFLWKNVDEATRRDSSHGLLNGGD